jgi:predicted DNA-binding transcriptional regulator AlpA
MAHHLKNSAAPGRRVTARGLDMASMPSPTSDPTTLFAASGSHSTKTDNMAAAYKPPIDPILRLPEVLEIVRVGRTTLLKMVKNGTFPAPLSLTARIRGWRLSAIQEFLDSLEGK